MRDKLAKRGHDSALVEQTLQRLAERDLLSDERFAQAFLRSRLERGQGPLKIRAQLMQRGVNGELINTILSETEIDWEERAAAARSRRFGEEPPEDRAEMARQARFLRARGFSEGQLAHTLLGQFAS